MDNAQLLAFAAAYFIQRQTSVVEITISKEGKVLALEAGAGWARSFTIVEGQGGTLHLEEDRDEDECRLCGERVSDDAMMCRCDEHDAPDDDHLYDGGDDDRYEVVQRAVGQRVLGKDRW